MNRPTAIALLGDFDPASLSHNATNDALAHAKASLRLSLQACWIHSQDISRQENAAFLTHYDGVWIAPGAYHDIEGVLSCIRTAREHHIPLLGTCGGFQCLLLEYARNVLGFADAQHEEYAPQAPQLFISRLPCSLVGQTLPITLKPDTAIARAYGTTRVQEQYRCGFGVNPLYADSLEKGPLRVVGADDDGVARIVELPGHPFFVGTLFVPQLQSSRESPHPVVLAFVKASALRHAAPPK